MKTKQTIYKTAGGCYKVGSKYFAYIDGALHEATKEECRAGKAGKAANDDDLVRVNSEDFINAVYDVWQKEDDRNAFLRKYEDRN
jgi:hypothetical protein